MDTQWFKYKFQWKDVFFFLFMYLYMYKHIYLYFLHNLYTRVYLKCSSTHASLIHAICFRLSGFQYQRQTCRDQKPHKSAAFSSDRMYSGYLMKVAVKPSPPILMFHFNICTPWDFSQYHLCSSAIIPFNCKTRFLRQCKRSSHLILTERMLGFFWFASDVFGFLGAAGHCNCHWDPRLHD